MIITNIKSLIVIIWKMINKLFFGLLLSNCN